MKAFAEVGSLPNGEIDGLLALRHANPHSVLGAHAMAGGLVVRAFRPEAERIQVIFDGQSHAMKRLRTEGLFELQLPGGEFPFAYQLEIRYPENRSFTLRDPYSFLPTLGDVDVYLAGEGRHEELWKKLGSHPCTLDGASGVAFAVWAPEAEGISVVGDFNGWDGRLHMLRKIGASGIWEIFLPDVELGAR
jgi:1,4-alpha-glucan branching enzyme